MPAIKDKLTDIAAIPHDDYATIMDEKMASPSSAFIVKGRFTHESESIR